MQQTTTGIETGTEDYELFDLQMSDKQLTSMLIKSLGKDIDHWNSEPFNFADTDEDNLRYLLGEQLDKRVLRSGETPYIDNRLFVATRAVLAYVNARVAMPEIAPSGSDKKMIQFARDFERAMYQHGVDNNLNRKAKAATKNLIVRKRAFLKLRFDLYCGPYGDIKVDVIDPADIIVSRFATYLNEPDRIYHKQRGTLEELGAMFPKEWTKIKNAFGIKRGVSTQMSKRTHWYESWFTYFEERFKREGLGWFLPQGNLILGKMQNPNWIYTGDEQEDKRINFSDYPIKPFVAFNYLNNGRSYLDETSLFDQAKMQQELLNKRGKQIWENADYVNGRWVADRDAMSQEDAQQFINKNPKTVALIKAGGRPLREVIDVQTPTMLPQWVENTMYDARNEIDQIMGTPNIFRGQQQQDANTLGENVLIKEQAGALQDDLAAAVDEAMADYYRKLAQMMKAYYTEDHWFQIKGDDGKYDHIVLNSQLIDGGTKVSVEAGSTLPSNKQELRATVIEAARLNRIDNLSFWEGLIYNKLPDPETIAERTLKETADPVAYLTDVEQEAFNRDADIDLALLIANKAPKDRDDYPQGYMEHFNKFIMGNRYTELPPESQQRINAFLAGILEKVMRTATLGETQVDDAAMGGMGEAEVIEQEAMV